MPAPIKHSELIEEGALQPTTRDAIALYNVLQQVIGSFKDVLVETQKLAQQNPFKSYADVEKAVQNLENAREATEGLTQAQKDIKEVTDQITRSFKEEAKIVNDVKGTYAENTRALADNRSERIRLNKEIAVYDKQLKEGQITVDQHTKKTRGLVKQLQELKIRTAETMQVTNAQTKRLDYAAGSMDEISSKLGAMKDAYRALSEQERENIHIGGRLLVAIAEEDEKIKQLDARIGNHQRNVGNYNGRLGGMVKTLQGARGPVSLLSHAFGLQSQAMQDARVGAEHLLQSYQQFKKGQENVSIGMRLWTFLVGKGTAAMKLFRLALISTGLGALVVTIGLIVANWDKLINTFDRVKDFFVGMGGAIKGLFSQIGEAFTQLFSGNFKEAFKAGANVGNAFIDGYKGAIQKRRDEVFKENQKTIVQNEIDTSEMLIDLTKARGNSTITLERNLLRQRIALASLTGEGIKKAENDLKVFEANLARERMERLQKERAEIEAMLKDFREATAQDRHKQLLQERKEYEGSAAFSEKQRDNEIKQSKFKLDSLAALGADYHAKTKEMDAKADAEQRADQEKRNAFALQQFERFQDRLDQIRLTRIDREINNAKRRQDELRNLAALGQKDAQKSIAAEEKRVAELERLKDKQARQQARRELRNAALSSFNAKVAAGDPNAVVNTIKDLTLLSAALATLPFFEKGTEYVDGPQNLDGKGGMLAVVHRGEKIFAREDAKAFGDLSNKEAARIMEQINTGTYSVNGMAVLPLVNDDGVKEIRGMRDDLKKLINNIPATTTRWDKISQVLTETTRRGNSVVRNRYNMRDLWR